MKRISILPIIFLWMLLGVSLVIAQGSCPAEIQLAFSRAYGACSGVERNEVCYGGGDVSIESQSAANDLTFAQPGDTIPVNDLQAISLESTDETLSTAFIRLQANLSTSSQRNVIGILYGSASLTNHIEDVPRLTAVPRGTVNIRSAPEQQAEIVEQVGVNGTLIANGRDEENQWLRVRIPNQDELGWISTEIVTLEGDINSLWVVTTEDVIQQPFEELTLSAPGNRLCGGTLLDGLLLQTPSLEETATLDMNGVRVEMAGTALFTGVPDTSLNIEMIEGTASVQAFGLIHHLAGGTHIEIALDGSTQPQAEPYDQTALLSAPYLYLDRRVQLPQPLSLDEIAALDDIIEPTPVPTATPSPDRCEYVVIGNQNIRNGPGSEFAIIRTISAGELVFPSGRTTDDSGGSWLRVGQQAWIQARGVEASDNCDPLPEISGEDVSTVSTNTLILESCDTTNGPILVGQRITIQFIPPAWENYATAVEATRYQHGAILVDDTFMYPWVSDPIKISDDEFIRRFSAEWTAQIGTYRIEGNFYSYERICTITVVPS